MFLSCLNAGSREIVVCMECSDRQVRTIGEALRKADPGDRIVVVWEPAFPIYSEHLVIDKPVHLISRSGDARPGGFDEHPVLTASFERYREVIDVNSPGVVIEGLNVSNLRSVPVVAGEDTRFEAEIGIRLRVPAVLTGCQVTKCRTAILFQYDAQKQESIITDCRIGYPTFTRWEPDIRNHPGNFFGIVIINPGGEPDSHSGGTITIRNCSITGNRFYGLVFPSDRMPQMENNIVELNGFRPFRVIQPEPPECGCFVWADSE